MRLGQRGTTLGEIIVLPLSLRWRKYFNLFFSETSEPTEIQLDWNSPLHCSVAIFVC